MSLILSGLLLDVVQVAGMLGGLAMSLLAEIYSRRKIMILGLLLLVFGSARSSFSQRGHSRYHGGRRIIDVPEKGKSRAAVLGEGEELLPHLEIHDRHR